MYYVFFKHLKADFYHVMFPGRYQLSNVFCWVNDDVLEKFLPVHRHRVVFIHPKDNQNEC